MSVNVPLGPLLDPAFHLGSVPTTWAELLGFATGAVNVWLVVRQNAPEARPRSLTTQPYRQ